MNLNPNNQPDEYVRKDVICLDDKTNFTNKKVEELNQLMAIDSIEVEKIDF